MISEVFDIVVVGARIAGSVVATKLGKSGINVLMIDKASFPSSTLSTYFFRAGRAVRVLAELGVLPEVLALDPPHLIQWYMYLNNAVTAAPNPIEPAGKIDFDLSVRREPLDDILVRRAKRCGHVRFLEKTVVKDLIWDNGRVAGVRLLNDEGEQTIRARLVIGADGRTSTVARLVDAPNEALEMGWRALYYCYAQGWNGPHGEPPDAFEISQADDELAYVFPSDGGYACLAVSVNREGFSWMKKALAARFLERFSSHKAFSNRIPALTMSGEGILGCGPTPNYMRKPFGPGWALVGDAGYHQDPWSGNGIDNATTHASFLADCLVDWFQGKRSEENALEEYHHYRNETGLPIYLETVEKSKDIRKLNNGNSE